MLKSIQSLRGIFALLIYFHHVEVFPAGGDSGVCFFTVLSGFVLCDGYQNRFRQNSISYGSFLKRRLARIYPLHLLCFIGAFLLTYQMAYNPVTWLVNLLLLQSWSPDPQVHFSANAVSWFLSMILFCYLLFPLIIRFLDRSHRNFYIASSILFAVYFVAIQFVPSGMLNNIIYINPLMRLPDFILGIILWQIIGGKIQAADSSAALNLRPLSKSAIELSALLLFALTLIIYGVVSPRYGLVSLWWPASIALISVFALFNDKGGIVTRLLQLRPLVFFGNISFSFYMIHLLVIKAAHRLADRFSPDMPPAIFIPLVLIVAVILAYFVWKYYERPMKRILLSRTS